MNSQKSLAIIILYFFFIQFINAQNVGINTTSPDPTAALDVVSTDKGILIPRTDTTIVNAAGTPTTGLMIYQTSDNHFYYYNGDKWLMMTAENDAVFEREGFLIRQTGNYGDNFILGRASLPNNGEIINDQFLIYDRSKYAFRGGRLLNSVNWSPDSIGVGSFSYGFNSKAKGDYSTSMGFQTNSIGLHSVAWGDNTTAIGINSTSWGTGSKSLGVGSTSWGTQTESIGERATAWGCFSDALGENSTSWGDHTKSLSYSETALGRYNTNYTPMSATNWNNSDRLFVIGNGTNDAQRNNALTIYKNGDFIIGHDELPENGINTTKKFMFFDQSRSAFRGGWLLNSVNWSPDSIGFGSFAYGYNTKAKGSYSTAMGYNTGATGNYSTAIGTDIEAPSAFETSLGIFNTTYTPVSTLFWEDLDRLFVIGNGTSSGTRHNALTILKNGDFIIGHDAVPQNGIDFSSDFIFFSKYKFALRGGRLLNSQNWSPDSIGIASIGYGIDVKAIGGGSAAFGYQTNAVGQRSFSGGYRTSALGTNSFSIGQKTIAYSFDEFVHGQFNSSYTPESLTLWDPSDRLFVIGNGTSSVDRQNALTILKNGDFIIGHDELPENGVFTTEDFMFFDESKSAFRGGRLYSSKNWSPDSIGISSFAYGYNTKAKGSYSTAMGYNTGATGSYSTAMGLNTKAKGDYSTAMGENTDATGDFSTAIGRNTEAIGNYSTAMGLNTKAKGDYSTAMGRNTDAPSIYETSIGSYNTTYAPSSSSSWNNSDRLFVIGNGTTDVNRSNAFTILKNGNATFGADIEIEAGSIDIIDNSTETKGQINLTETQGTDGVRILFKNGVETNNKWTTWGKADNTIADGFYNIHYTTTGNILTVRGNGKVGIKRNPATNTFEVNGTASKSSSGSWLANSDKRLKTNINTISTKTALDKILSLRGVTYEWNDDKTGNTRPTGLQYGFVAQELMEIFPNKVSMDNLGYFQTAYGDYDPLFVQAFKELSQKILTLEVDKKEKEQRIRLLEERLEKIEAMINGE